MPSIILPQSPCHVCALAHLAHVIGDISEAPPVPETLTATDCNASHTQRSIPYSEYPLCVCGGESDLCHWLNGKKENTGTLCVPFAFPGSWQEHHPSALHPQIRHQPLRSLP